MDVPTDEVARLEAAREQGALGCKSKGQDSTAAIELVEPFESSDDLVVALLAEQAQCGL
jgi:hypothetical protein